MTMCKYVIVLYNTGVAVMLNTATLYGSWAYYYNYYYHCYSSSTSLTSCHTHQGYGNCNGNNHHAGVWCLTVPPAGNAGRVCDMLSELTRTQLCPIVLCVVTNLVYSPESPDCTKYDSCLYNTTCISIVCSHALKPI